jgi:hypothetical protein
MADTWTVAPPIAPNFLALSIGGNIVTPPGLVGDGVANESAAIMAAINAAPNGTRFYFPAGVYLVHSGEGPPPLGVFVNGRANMEFFGDGTATVFKWDTSQTGTAMMTFTACDNFLFHDLVFDNASSPAFGGMRFYGMRRFEVRDCIFDDSTGLNDQPEGMDRYGLVLGRTNRTHQDVRIYRNFCNKVQLEVDEVERAAIYNNRVYRGWQTAGIGCFTMGGAGTIADVLIENNTIIDPQPPGSAIAVHMDPPEDWACLVQRVTIRNNHILIKDPSAAFAGTLPGGCGMSIGQPYVVAEPRGNVWEDIAVVGNHIRVLTGGSGELIRFYSNEFMDFDRVWIKDNVIHGATPVGNPPVESTVGLRFIRRLVLSGNQILDVYYAVNTSQQMLGEVHDNYLVGNYATTPANPPRYISYNSRGNNTWGPNNTGSPGSVYEWGDGGQTYGDEVIP